MAGNDKMIRGKKAICGAVQRRWAVVLNWIQTRGFPAVKMDGIWESHPDLIDAWRRRQILRGRELGNEAQEKPP